jgi:hypothetical protein
MLSVIILRVVLLNALNKPFVLSVVMLSVIMLSVVMQNVVAAKNNLIEDTSNKVNRTNV